MSYTPLPISSPDALHDLSLHSLQSAPGPQDMACLSSAELGRAARFLRERDRRRFLAARCALRQRLAQHLGVSAGALRFVEGPEGKPFLADAPRCYFNLSHSEDLALVGVCDRFEIGVDIEVLRPVPDARSLARSLFTAAEIEAFAAVDNTLHEAVFLRVWTRKEACLKALGTGLSLEPRMLDVGVGADTVDVDVELSTGSQRVQICSVDAGSHAVAAVAWLTGKSVQGLD